MKTRTSILIEDEILRTAQELGLNVSKTCENSLILLINSIKKQNTRILGLGARLIICAETPSWKVSALPNGGEMRDLEVEGSNLSPGISKIDWEKFEAWLSKDKTAAVVRDVLNYSRRYSHCLFSGDLSEVSALSVGKRRMVLASLSNLSKYLGCYDSWKQTIKKFGIKWVTVGAKDKRIIDRITKKSDVNVVYEWVKEAKLAYPEYSCFMDFVCLSGLRLIEAIASWNLIKSTKNLDEYYDRENQVLTHYKYQDKFLRKGKKAFISFVPADLIERIRNSDLEIGSRHTIAKAIGGATHFSDLREAYASLLTKYLKASEIDFLQGRIGSSVFMQNYFNPALICDLKDRVFKGILEIKSLIT